LVLGRGRPNSRREGNKEGEEEKLRAYPTEVSSMRGGDSQEEGRADDLKRGKTGGERPS